MADMIIPKFPDEPFMLEAQLDGWQLGPFPSGAVFERLPDGTMYFSDGITHPVYLRVRSQRGDLIQANDGPVPMDYRIITVREANLRKRQERGTA